MNLKPRGLEVLDCIVEECDERFSEMQQEEIVRIVGEVFPEDTVETVNGEGEGDVQDG